MDQEEREMQAEKIRLLREQNELLKQKPTCMLDQMPEKTTTEEAAPIDPKDEKAFCALLLSPRETITVFGALRLYHQALANQEALQVEAVSTVLEVIKTLQPMASQAASYFQSDAPI